MQKKHEEILARLNETSTKLFSCNISETTEKQAYKVVGTLLREMLAKKRKEYKESYKGSDRKKRPRSIRSPMIWVYFSPSSSFPAVWMPWDACSARNFSSSEIRKTM